jgi:hypothetical protein
MMVPRQHQLPEKVSLALGQGHVDAAAYRRSTPRSAP